MAGLPAAGKTTYLVALYMSMMAGESKLTRSGYSDDREYMNDLSDKVFALAPVERTRADRNLSLSLAVETPSHRTGRLVVPDRSGEIWEQLVIDRTLEASISDMLSEAEGICVFINTETYRHDPLIVDITQVSDVFPSADSTNAIVDDKVHPEQVKITEMVQLLASKRYPSTFRISIVLSAFDSVDAHGPARWLADNIPLLDQYLRSNVATLHSRVFGVSAQGGSLVNPVTRKALEAVNPAERAWAKDDNGVSCAIESPMLWALGEI
nr:MULTISPECIES: hypothetical protein [unclassified Rathayibacter]